VLDSPFRDLDDVDAAALDNHRSRALGFTGRALIHPRMVDGVNAAFAPSAEEIAEAEALVAAYEAAGGGVARLGNKLVERPVFLRMSRLLERARSRA
jgi:(S)-citramalyl-CoA lyase